MRRPGQNAVGKFNESCCDSAERNTWQQDIYHLIPRQSQEVVEGQPRDRLFHEFAVRSVEEQGVEVGQRRLLPPLL